MNLFTSLQFPRSDITPVDAPDGERPRYGAATVADELRHQFGNAFASRRRFGESARRPQGAAYCVEGGCG